MFFRAHLTLSKVKKKFVFLSIYFVRKSSTYLDFQTIKIAIFYVCILICSLLTAICQNSSEKELARHFLEKVPKKI